MSGIRQPLKKFLRQSWPETDADLLIRTAFLPAEEAKRCWRAWKERNDIDLCSWPQYKVLARLSGLISEIDPACPEVPRLNGMAKAQWTKSQLDINRAARSLDVLGEAGIDVMLLKTAALEAMQLTRHTRRITSDIDLMVPMADFRRALELLWAHDWRNGDHMEKVFKRRLRHAGVNLVHADGGDVDLHLQPVHLPFLGQERCKSLWQSASPADFRGRAIMVPGTADLIVITAMQGVRRHIPGHKSGAMWAFDIVEILDRMQVNWDEILATAMKLEGSFALLSCLEYVRSRLGVAVPADVIQQLVVQCSTVGEAVSYFAQSPSSGRARPLLLPLREAVLIGCQERYFHRASKDLAVG